MTAEDLKYLSIEINLTFAMKVIADYWKKKSSYSLFKPQNIAIQVIRMEPTEIKQKKKLQHETNGENCMYSANSWKELNGKCARHTGAEGKLHK